ncbi:MltA-interacting protein precursor [Marinomonas spartinae]|uniref:MipA/OmpV family protein n=1 Tax=Marinomonas spartinae TaxID=1792290 RepID=UPI000808B109|nr:MipA/OmpV family protein [Marinomonas spartinae]SBS28235.1 MltA-interacting protein precursor [Marinomonas spartinae]
MLRSLLPLVAIVPPLLLSNNALGADFSFGVAGTRISSIYKDTPPQNAAFPFVSIVSERGYLKGTEVGYSLFPNESQQNISAIVEYSMDSFDPDDSNNKQMQLLDRRKATAMAGVRLKYNFLFAKLVTDIGNRHDGYYGLVGAAYPVNVSAWRITPSITYKYLDKKMSNHLYGVSQAESIRTGGIIPEYHSDNTRKVTIAVRGDYSVSASLNLFVGVSHSDYKSVLDSPIVTKDYSYSASAGIIYHF